ncbi:hypothetical protein A2G06_16875 (plasmid) [Geobacter anodireducens]|nr:hypothetical protein A2G06_16875 [Geobacter anodireducens]
MVKSNVIPFERRRTEHLRPLGIPVPPTLEEAICYPGNERYVALWWSRSGEDIAFDDGYRSGTGYSYGWLAFARHEAIAPILSRLDYVDYDDDDRTARERLLLDRYQRRFFCGRAEFVMAFVREENMVVEHDGPPIVLTQGQLDEIAATMREHLAVPREELERRMEEHRRQLKQMLDWLDLQASRSR